jgi:type II secretory pathway component PulF
LNASPSAAHSKEETGTVVFAVEQTALAFLQLAELLKAGLPLSEALHTLASDADHGRLPQALQRAAASMENGLTAEVAFAAEEKTLGSLPARIFSAAQGNRELPALLSELSRWTLEQDRMRKEIREALRYPLMVVFTASVAFLAIPIYATGRQILREMDLGTLPLIIENLWVYDLLLRISSVVGILLAIVFVVTGLPLSANRRLAGWWQKVLIVTPVLGAVARPMALTRFCSSCALLVRAGVPCHQAITAAGTLTGFEPYERAAREVAQRLEAGVPAEAVWTDRRLFPDTFRFLIRCGMEDGSLANAFSEAAELYHLETEGRIRLAALLLPPLALTFVGAMVLMAVLQMLIPLLSMAHCSCGLGR